MQYIYMELGYVGGGWTRPNWNARVELKIEPAIDWSNTIRSDDKMTVWGRMH